MKRILLSCVVFASLSLNAQTTFKVDYVEYTTTSATTCEVTDADNNDADGNVISSFNIPSTVENDGTTYTVTSVGEYAFHWNNMTSLTLPETVDSLKRCAIYSCSKLTEVTLPAKLKYIGDYALSSLAITSIDIPASVEEIGNSAFFTCYSLASVTGMQGVKKMGSSVFYKCAITEIALPESLDSIPHGLFMECSNLTKVTLSPKTYYIGDGAFYNCKALESITLPSTVKTIDDECFMGCSSLTSFTLPASTETIGTSILAGTSVATLAVESGNSNFMLNSGCIYSADKKLLYLTPLKGVSSISVIRGCIGINGGAFYGSEATKVTLPDGMLAIDDMAFCLSSLAEINFPSSLIFMGEQALAGTQLTEITLPENMPNISDALLASCEKLTTVTIPSGVSYIALRAFYGCTSLKTINALGSTAPELEEMYDDWEGQFYKVSGATIYVPKGSSDSYKSAGYGDYLTIAESETATFKYESTTPADGSTVAPGWVDKKFYVTFNEPVTIVESTPDAYLREGGETGGKVIECDDSWRAQVGDDANTLYIWGCDYDGYTESFKAVEGTSYCMIIPAGVVKNAAGELNERIVINFTCKEEEPQVLELVSTTPADKSTLTSTYANMTYELTFAENISIANSAPDVKLYVGEEGSSDVISPYSSWVATLASDGVSVRVWGDDGDGGVDYFKVTEGQTYTLVIPAGVVKNSAGVTNDKIVLTFNPSSTDSIYGIEGAEGTAVSGRFTISGQKIGTAQRGINILKMADGTVRKVLVK